jgi:hypothetical protein
MPERLYCEQWCLCPTHRLNVPYDLPHLYGRFSVVVDNEKAERWSISVLGNTRMYLYTRVVRREPVAETPWYHLSTGSARWGGYADVERVTEFSEPPADVLAEQVKWYEAQRQRSLARQRRPPS